MLPFGKNSPCFGAFCSHYWKFVKDFPFFETKITRQYWRTSTDHWNRQKLAVRYWVCHNELTNGTEIPGHFRLNGKRGIRLTVPILSRYFPAE